MIEYTVTVTARDAMALDFIDAEIARGNLALGYPEIVAHLIGRTGEESTVGMVAGLLDRYGERDSAAWAAALDRGG